MDLKKQLDIITAQLDGKDVEFFSCVTLDWEPLVKGDYVFDFYNTRYRIKPIKKVLYQYLLRSKDNASYFYSSYNFYESALHCQKENPNGIVIQRLNHTKIEVFE